ncbi:hypothetical protein [Pseudoalteromonas nigrifaciens]|nr:hypothetical protein [Pseudoalteromonas nigrifaciens]
MMIFDAVTEAKLLKNEGGTESLKLSDVDKLIINLISNDPHITNAQLVVASETSLSTI